MPGLFCARPACVQVEQPGLHRLQRDSVTDSSVTVDREVFVLCSDGLYCHNYAGWLRYLTA